MFCSQCGHKLEPQSLFCSRCGHRVASQEPQSAPQPPSITPSPPAAPPYQAPAAPQYQAPAAQYQASATPMAPGAETVVWVFQASRKLSMLKVVPCFVVFMRDRAVLAHLSPAMQKEQSAKAAADIKSSGLGFFKGSAAMMRFWSEYSSKYYAMSTNAILAEDPSNVVLYYAALTEVYFKCYSESTDYENSTSSSNAGKLYFSVSGGDKIKLTHSQPHAKSIRETFNGLLGSRLKYRK